MKIPAWAHPPSAAELTQYPNARYLLVCLRENTIPDWSEIPDLQQSLSCLQFDGANVIRLPHSQQTLYVLPSVCAHRWTEYFDSEDINWQTPEITPEIPPPEPLWFVSPPTRRQPEHVVVVGAGIAGACTAYELAKLGVRVTVLDSAAQVASGASGNRQGLLYAKIAPHPTPQTELLMCSYGYARNLLKTMQPEDFTEHFSGASGVLHLNYSESETKRNQLLAQHQHHQHLYYGVSAQQATELAGINITQDGLFWQHGAWVNPQKWIQTLLSHPNIQLKLNQKLQYLQYDKYGQNWQIQTQSDHFQASHVVFCTGSGSLNTPLVRDFPFQIIRGQSSVVPSSVYSNQLKIALSGASYFAPEWENQHCFGATFFPNNPDTHWHEHDELHNQNQLFELNSELHQSLNFNFKNTPRGHTALRCDAHDHLPVVGALGQPEAMKNVYAKLALDKNYRVQAACPFYPNVYVNTAHGSRGLTTAPLCAAYLAAMICGEPFVLSRRLRHALHPNRLIIRQIIRGS